MFFDIFLLLSPNSSIFDAFVGEFLVKTISHKWAESPCQQSSTGLSGSACIRTLRQEGRKPNTTVFNCCVGFCLN